MGKNHASQYANFGSLLDKNLPKFKERTNIRDIFVCLDNVGCNFQLQFPILLYKVGVSFTSFYFKNIHENH